MMKPNLDAFPEELKKLKNWVCWKFEPDSSAMKKKKPPIDPISGNKISVNDSSARVTCATALNRLKKVGADGVGIVLTQDIVISVFDIDGCRDMKTGKINSYALGIMKMFPSYTEVSPSGTGIHIYIYGSLPGPGINTEEVEVYDRGRYMTVTGQHVKGSPTGIKKWQRKLNKWYATLQKPSKSARSTEAPAIATGSDMTIVGQVLQMDKKGSFAKLLSGDTSGYPSPSDADLAFCSFLSGVTTSPDVIDRIFRSSGMMRPKWDEVHGKQTYGDITIAKVLKNPHAAYSSCLNEKSTEFEIALAVIKRFGRKNLYCLAKQSWLWQKNDGVWSIVDDAVIKKLIHRTAHVKSISNGRVNSVFGLIITEVYSKVSRFGDCNNRVINCSNGELHFENDAWSLKPHDRDSNFCHQIPVKFDQEATCHRFDYFLKEIFSPDDDQKEKIRLVQEFLGYVLITSCEFERFLLLVGSGSNGKSVLMKVLIALVGKQYVCSVQPNKFEELPELGHLHGKLVNVVTEIPVGAVIADAKLKSITSGELIHAAHKYGHPFDFNPYCTLIFSANHLPHTKDCSPAFFRRAEVLTFNREFKEDERDTTLADTLTHEELPGILNFALKGLRRLYKKGDFTKVPSSKATKREWELAADQVAAFIDEECELDPAARIPISELYNHYKHWATESGIKSNVNKPNLTSRLKRMGCKPHRTGRVRMLTGVTIKSE